MRRRFPVVCLALAAGLAGCDSSAGPSLAAEIETEFRSAHEDGAFACSALVTRGGATVYSGGFGMADEERKIANAPATKFLGYSLTKPLTAILVFQQIEAGKLALADPLSRFFPELEGSAAGALTIEQLVTHTSRIEEVISKHKDRRIVPADLRDAAVRNPRHFEYSSSGYVILALVLEKVTGRGYAELLEERILRPADMRDSGTMRSGVPVAGLAIGYHTKAGRRAPEPLDVPPEVLEGAGSLYATTGDLAKLDRALAAGKLLTPASQAAMLKQSSPERAYGWSLAEQGGAYFPWHKGSYRGFTSALVRQIHRDEAVVILCNDAAADVDGVRKKVLRLLKRSPAGS